MTGFTPFVLYRRGTLGFPALSGLVPADAWSMLDEAEAAETRARELQGPLEDALYTAVPELSPGDRRAVLAVRRGIHNGLVRELPAATRNLPQACRELLDQWSHFAGTAQRLRREAEETLLVELKTARKQLAEIALDEDVQRGIQLSGEDVYRTVMDFAADPFGGSWKPSRRRRAESTVVSFASRIVFKPSPFGSFTEIGAQPWDKPATAGPGRRTSLVRLNIGLLAWLAYQLRLIDGADRLMRIRLNNTLTVHDDRAVYIRRPPEGADEGFDGDKVVSVRFTALVKILIDRLGEHDLTEPQLREQLIAAGVAPTKAAETIDALIRGGLCQRGLGLPDQTSRYAEAVARMLRDLGTAQAEECAAVFERLQAIEDGYAAASAARRTGLLAEIRGLCERLAEICGCPPPGRDALRATVYEDVGTTVPAHSWRPEVLRSNEDAIRVFQRVVPVLDDASIEKLGLYRFFVDRYADAGRDGVPVVEVFQAFSELSRGEMARVVAGVGDDCCERVRELRNDFFDLVRETLAGREHEPEIALDLGRLGEFADRVPAFVPPWRSTAYRMQFGGTADRPRVVVNGVTTGHGVFFSRFCDLLRPDSPEDWDLRQALGEHIARTQPRQTDVTAVLGLNFNLHPKLAPLELVYPGSIPEPDRAESLTLAEVVVRARPADRRLELVSAKDGRALDLVPLNFLYPAAAPTLYRFLVSFAPTRTYRGGLWDQLDRAPGGAARAGSRPRILLGDLVLDRRSWRFEPEQMADLEGLEVEDTEALIRFDRWRRAAGLPRHCFFRVSLPPAVPPGERDPVAETRRWALEARTARLHKPHYLDARNPFLLSVLARQISAAGGAVLFQEALPDVDTYTGRGPGGQTSAEEFFVEYNAFGGGHADA